MGRFLQPGESLCTADHIGGFTLPAPNPRVFPAALFAQLQTPQKEDLVGIPARRGDANEAGHVASIATERCFTAS